MSGELALYDVTRTNPVAADYLDGIDAGDESVESVTWLKNVGTSQVGPISVEIAAVDGGDGASMLVLSEGVAVASPAAPVAAAAAGTIAGPLTRHYKVAALGVANGPSLPSPEVSYLIVGAGEGVALSWAAVPNALGYAVYSSEDNIDFYLKDTVVGGLTYTDTDGSVDAGAELAVTLNQAFRASAYVAGPLSIGNLDPGDMRPIIYRAEVPLGTTVAANTRRADILVSGNTL